jgi:hypothetical protein
LNPPAALKLRRKYEVDESHWLVQYYRRTMKWLRPRAQQMWIVIQWRGLPKDHEVAFVMRMKELEAKGLTFEEVIRSTTPKVFGEVPGQVLLRWIGKKARHSPMDFVKALRRMFGKSSGPALQALQSFVDAEGLLDAKKPYVPANQYLVEAMIRNGMIEP